MYVAGWSTVRHRTPAVSCVVRFGAALGTEGELNGGDEAADG
jgi:hypothetical protein